MFNILRCNFVQNELNFLSMLGAPWEELKVHVVVAAAMALDGVPSNDSSVHLHSTCSS